MTTYCDDLDQIENCVQNLKSKIAKLTMADPNPQRIPDGYYYIITATPTDDIKTFDNQEDLIAFLTKIDWPAKTNVTIELSPYQPGWEWSA